MVSKLKSGAALALLVSAAISAHAAGLGKLTVNSALGQPLNAEIELLSLQPGEADNLSARVASTDAFREARIEYSGALRMLRFSVEKNASGRAYLKVTSVGPINEPFVDVLIEMSWPSGRIQREYPILLDPPGYSQAKINAPVTSAAPAAAAPTPPATSAPAAPADSTSTASTSTAPAVQEPTTSASSSSPAPSDSTASVGTPSAQAELLRSDKSSSSASSTPAATAGDTYGPIEKGETLSKIAAQVKPADVSLEQMLVALYRQNQDAFSGKNMNRLKSGQILKVPTQEEIAAIEQKDAAREIHTQVTDWKAYRDQLATGAASLPTPAESSTASSGRVTSAAVTPPAPPSSAGSDSLKLSKSDVNGKAGATKGGGSANPERLNQLQEELIAKDKALRESQSRVSDLEKQIQDMQRLLDLKSGAPATKGDKLATATTTPTPTPAKPATGEPPKSATPATATTPTPAEPPKVAANEPPKSATTPEPAKTPDTTAATTPPAATPSEPPKTEGSTTPPTEPPKTAAAEPAKAPKKVVPPPKSFMDELLDNPAYLAAGGGILLALIAGFALMRRRRNREEMDPNSQLTSAFPSDLKPGGNTSKPAGGLVDTGNSSFLTDFDKTGPGTIDTDEVDPVAEAEVYMAYGRDAQAEEILKEAMARDRNRHEIALKLLEIYHARKSATAFETVAKELHSAVGDNHPLWQKAAAMGAQIDPSNPLYVAAAAGTATYQPLHQEPSAPAKPNLDFDLDSSSSAATSSSAPAFDLDLDAQKPAPKAEEPSSSGLDFDLNPAHAQPAMDMPAEQPQKEDKPSFDFDLSGLDFPSSKPSSSGAAPAPSGGNMDLADLSLDSPSSGGDGGEAVGTKLELAKAYLEIGDKDGAREILQEVAKEGSSAQREEAKKLISSL